VAHFKSQQDKDGSQVQASQEDAKYESIYNSLTAVLLYFRGVTVRKIRKWAYIHIHEVAK
jgi:hypothetical protein